MPLSADTRKADRKHPSVSGRPSTPYVSALMKWDALLIHLAFHKCSNYFHAPSLTAAFLNLISLWLHSPGLSTSLLSPGWGLFSPHEAYAYCFKKH